MFELWIPFTIAAAFFQNLRSALQKHLKSRLSTAGATYVRFFYAWPFAVVYVWGLTRFGGFEVPAVNTGFLIYCFLGGLSQIIFTFLLIWLFSFRNFAVGTTYSKTETVQVALLGFLILGDSLSLGAVAAIGISLIGVLALSVAQTKISAANLITSLTEKPTLIGLTCGAFLGASVVLFRGGALALGGDGFLMQAGFTLAVSVIMQTVMMGLYLAFRERDQLKAVLVHWRPSLSVGVAGALASICWFTAFTMQNAAYVRALGQIELIFTFIASAVFFREKINRLEFTGILLVAGGILILLLVG
ncbi:MAG TPA: DMT family transporter [Rhodospirillales bacterium]|jgi:drug/metabolite transporter (DMT)-like permease|nr:DMT family transporter [Rhodospirillales bacterium]